MPRNGNGTYALPEAAFTPNTTISSTAVNSDFSDIADAVTDSLARNGEGGMTAVLPLTSNGFNYITDPNTGMRRTAADKQVIYAGGTDVAEYSASGVSITGSFSVSGAFAIPNGSITSAMLRDSAALSIIGRAADTSGVSADISAGNDGEVLRRNGTSIGFGTLIPASFANNTIAYGKFVSAATATQSDMESFNTTDKIVTPARMGFHPGMPKAWVMFDGVTGTIDSGYNIASVVHIGTGEWRITFTTPFADVNYSIFCSYFDAASPRFFWVKLQLAASAVVTANTAGLAAVDLTKGYVAFFGDQ